MEFDQKTFLTGMNLSALNDYNNEHPFKNIFKTCRLWRTTGLNYGSLSDSKNIESFILDNNGYPLKVPYNNEIVYTLLFWGGNVIFSDGIYTLTYEGEGELLISESGRIIKDSIVKNRNHTSCKILVKQLHNKGIKVSILNSIEGNHIRNIQILLPTEEKDEILNPFNQFFIKAISPFQILRYKDWCRTDNCSIRLWEDRAPESYYTGNFSYNEFKSLHQKGIAYEWVIKLANITQKSIWINIPHRADDNYIVKMADLICNLISPSIKVFIEYSNELWNTDYFVQGFWVSANSKSIKRLPQAVALRINHVFRLFQKVIRNKGKSNQFVFVLSGAGYSRMLRWDKTLLSYIDRELIDIYSCSAYFSPKLKKKIKNPDDLVNQTIININSSLAPKVIEIKKLCNSYNLPIIFYEGGPNFENAQNSLNDLELINEIYQNNNIYNLYKYWLDFLKDEIQSNGFLGFDLASNTSFKHILSIYHDLESNPKYMALVDRSIRTHNGSYDKVVD